MTPNSLDVYEALLAQLGTTGVAVYEGIDAERAAQQHIASDGSIIGLPAIYVRVSRESPQANGANAPDQDFLRTYEITGLVSASSDYERQLSQLLFDVRRALAQRALDDRSCLSSLTIGDVLFTPPAISGRVASFSLECSIAYSEIFYEL